MTAMPTEGTAFVDETGYTGLYKTGEELALEEAEREMSAIFDTYN